MVPAATGIQHSEFNPSDGEAAHFYQIWLVPDRKGHDPSYEQKQFPKDSRRNRLQQVALPDGRDGSLTTHQDAHIYLAEIDSKKTISYEPAPGRHAWLLVLRGSVALNGVELDTSDGAAVSEETLLGIEAIRPAEVMLFDLP